MRSLSATEAMARASSISVSSYDIHLDLTRGPDTFRSHTTVEFRSQDKADTFVDISAAQIETATLNGEPLDPARVDEGRLALTGLSDDNKLVVAGLFSYSHDGEGLHRAVDPEDKQVYVYAMTFLPAAPRVFACFDQPDLKARYRISVAAPEDWTVLGNGAATRTAPGEWELAETKPLATYFVTLVAGPYHSVAGEHDGITLGLHCRASLAPHLDKDAAELFEVTGQCLDEYHRLFGIRYPFGEYHQAFVPDFNAGAMENPGCVTFADTLIFKAQATDSLRATRANVVAHEMAHQWFGDFVTMQWWDDLWLNESFAEYMGYRVTSEVTRFDDVWVEYTFNTKAWGLAADQRSSTHPIAGNGAADAQQALTDFDGISYSKGTAALRQLNAYLGDGAFLAGVIDHLTSHSYGNATLADLVSSWEKASGKDVNGWAEAWLRTSGVDVLSTDVDIDGSVVVSRINGSPVDVQRPHAFTVTAYDETGQGRSEQLDLTGDITTMDFGPLDPKGLVLPDSADATWAKVRLDDQSLFRIPDLLPRINDPLARAVVWGVLREGILDGTIDPELFVCTIEQVLHREIDLAVEHILSEAVVELGRYLAADDDRSRLATVATTILGEAAPGSNRQLVAVRSLISLTDDPGLLRRWLGGSGRPDGLVADENFRWRITRSLCSLGDFGPDDVEAEQQRDPSSQGALHALECRSAMPEPRTKDQAWTAITTDASLSNAELYSAASFFFRPGQEDLTEAYVERYFTEMPATAEIRTGWIVDRSVLLGYPRFSLSPQQTLQLAETCLARKDLDTGVRRSISDETDDLRRVLSSRRAFARSSPFEKSGETTS
ncbi:MAG: aminopeptidase N [Propionibacteriales bacterium]|nr:aminopeptidase N [Propionibacteriales bacterium]